MGSIIFADIGKKQTFVDTVFYSSEPLAYKILNHLGRNKISLHTPAELESIGISHRRFNSETRGFNTLRPG